MSEKPTYWRSLADLERTPEFKEFLSREFPHAMVENVPEVDRRRFVQLLGASLALAGCRWEQEKLMPMSRKPGDALPGVPKRYATAMELDGSAVGLHVTSYDGRPIKIEGSPKHPSSMGAAGVWEQASILDLYDPDRQTAVTMFDGKVETASTWEKFAAQATDVIRRFRRNDGRGLRILSHTSSSPTLRRLRERFLNLAPEAKWIEYDPICRDAEIEGSKLAFGKPYRTHWKLDQADVVVALDNDFLTQHPDSLRLTREFAKRRTAGDAGDGPVSRFYAVETRFSPTGAKADHRLPLRAEQIKPFLLALEAKATGAGADASGGGSFLAEPHVVKFLDALASDLKEAKGQCVVTVGVGQPAEVHAIVHRLNAALGAVGKTVSYTEEPNAGGQLAALAALVKEMAVGDVQGLIVLGGNPVYDAPMDLGFGEALAKVGFSAHLSTYKNETSLKCQWRLPATHYLEQWADARGYDGTTTFVQPLIEPIFPECRSPIDLGLLLLQAPTGLAECLKAVRETHGFAVDPKKPDEKKDGDWRKLVEAGFVEGSAYKPQTPTLMTLADAVTKVEPRALKSKIGVDELEVVFAACPKVYDGRYSNNAWLQELPDPMTKMVWDNAAIMSKQTAEALKLPLDTDNAGMTRIAFQGPNKRELEIPAYVMPGHAVGSITLFLGYGRTAAGYVGGSPQSKIDVPGFDTYKLRTSAAPFIATGASATPTGATYKLVCTQEHHLIDVLGMRERERRLGELVVQTTAVEAAKPGFKLHTGAHHGGLHVLSADEVKEAAPHAQNLTPWHEWEYKGARWGMAVDLSKCTGCNACVIACQAENNIPIVGKDQVWRNREMHWIRIDRYFKGDADHPETLQSVQQPMACVQCENAPCESVCPVAATVHSPEGLNDMVYNRCIGTRYCSNNCPYKVRRFNFLNYQTMIGLPENDLRNMVYNPEVTVRHRGVMEKCTYCVQRIQNVKIVAKREGRAIRDGEIVPACAQTCAAEAIVFGDLGQPTKSKSKVAVQHESKRAYTVLEEMNNKPRTKYLAAVRNPNPKLTASHTEKASDEHGHG